MVSHFSLNRHFMRFEEWFPAFAGMTENGVFGQSVPAPGLNRCKQESRNCESIA
ncbi:hypothetical protein MBAV_005674 [Candidatus Magnetobacterium bavaricum]|uniref:Uncharacterized protein n=1 Tax=Candidatus Magnetobacterium bavaricum TaxID=29290 RepID=A0A0F3GN62_9BACT|nr:hypothetical protein MBAV_005665 [Candidatus Magnetobacterium bavaricum]KJU82142.1 hypothetical protein MBAV_005674 [Candidatus Magnetobacterium bavaricum]